MTRLEEFSYCGLSAHPIARSIPSVGQKPRVDAEIRSLTALETSMAMRVSEEEIVFILDKIKKQEEITESDTMLMHRLLLEVMRSYDAKEKYWKLLVKAGVEPETDVVDSDKLTPLGGITGANWQFMIEQQRFDHLGDQWKRIAMSYGLTLDLCKSFRAHHACASPG